MSDDKHFRIHVAVPDYLRRPDFVDFLRDPYKYISACAWNQTPLELRHDGELIFVCVPVGQEATWTIGEEKTGARLWSIGIKDDGTFVSMIPSTPEIDAAFGVPAPKNWQRPVPPWEEDPERYAPPSTPPMQ